MRLLKVGSLTLEEFFEPNVPKYAILSHTWDKEEVLFEDIRDIAQATTKLGFIKVKEACDLAASQGYEYIWIDTCCIDKSSSAELTEAINSMYRWYKESDVCYAFISDVTTDDPHTTQHSLPLQLRSSRWFTRGWTLQELLAPDNVQFYDSTWRLIGNKKDGNLCSMISEITMIDQSVLNGKGRGLHDISIARRMYWASKRQTTRTEDLAYSLLGIFDINMPLMYGEGHKAFRRLQEEILKTTDDQSIFAWQRGDLEGSAVDILAHSPSDFADSGAVSPYAPFRVNRKATSITNQGIVLELPILSVPSPLHTDYSPFEEIEAILDCQLGSAPGTFPTIRLRSVEGPGVNGPRHYYRIMTGVEMTKLENHSVLDLLTEDVIGFDPTQLDQNMYKKVLDKLNWSWKVETVIITRRVPRPRREADSVQIPWSLSLLRHDYPADDTPFWLLCFTQSRDVWLQPAYPKKNWDASLSQMRVSPIPKEAFGRGRLCQVVGVFDICMNRMSESDWSVSLNIASLIIGRKSFHRRDPYVKPWCRIETPRAGTGEGSSGPRDEGNVDTELLSSRGDTEDASQFDTYHVKLHASVRPVEVSGRFYHIVSLSVRDHGGRDDEGLRLMNGTSVYETIQPNDANLI